MKLFITILVCLLFAFVMWANWASYTKLRPGMANQEIEVKNNIASKVNASEFKIMTWNLGFAFGVGSEGPGYKPLSRSEMEGKIQMALETIQRENPDILFLQEVDFDADRSHNIDQLAVIADKLGYPYRAYATSWTANYLPFPYWPIGHHFKKIKSGGGVVSRFPITANEVMIWEKPKTNPWWYNLFYLFRYSQFVTFKIGEKELVAVNNHLEAFAKETRMKQANDLKKLIENRMSYGQEFLVMAGDMNTTPTNAKLKSGFREYEQDNYENDTTYATLASVPDLLEIVSLQEYADDEKIWFTFSSVDLQRRLDYLFINKKFQVIHREVPESRASDHLPVVAVIKTTES